MWLVRNRNGTVPFVEHRIDGVFAIFLRVEKAVAAPVGNQALIPKKHAPKQFSDARQDLTGAAEMYLYFPEKSFTFSTFSGHLDDLGPRLTSAALLRKQKKS